MACRAERHGGARRRHPVRRHVPRLLATTAGPAIRLAALSEFRSIFVFTHDSIGLGEDGPTHQPIEHLMALRAMPAAHASSVPPTRTRRRWPGRSPIEHHDGPTAARALAPGAAASCRHGERRRAGPAARRLRRQRGRGRPPRRDHHRHRLGGQRSPSKRRTLLARARRARARRQHAVLGAVRAAGPRRIATRCCRRDVRARVSVEAGVTLGWQRWVGDDGDSHRHRWPLRRVGARRRSCCEKLGLHGGERRGARRSPLVERLSGVRA